ncbi:MAG: WecB/TagA/CpsF family glycosyltransferase [Microgenomates group bacterium]
MNKKDRKIVKILGINLNSNRYNEVLNYLEEGIKRGKKTFLVTVNPEFVVYAQENKRFKEILNLADMAVADGIGLVWASRYLKWRGKTSYSLPERIAGADLVEDLLRLGQTYRWQIGVVGARNHDDSGEERRRQIKILQEKFKGAKIFSLEETPNWQKQKWDIVFACQGMGKQEEWIKKNLPKNDILLAMGVGGALDFLTGFVPRAPLFIRKIGFEWLFRLLIQPWRWRRQINLLKFVWLVFLDR